MLAPLTPVQRKQLSADPEVTAAGDVDLRQSSIVTCWPLTSLRASGRFAPRLKNAEERALGPLFCSTL